MLSRRGLLGLSAAAGAGALASACGGDDDDDERRRRAAADREIVRYLLRLERVENAFWTQVVDQGALDGTEAAGFAEDIARNEREHLEGLERFVRRLGGDGGAQAETSFDDVFAAGPKEVLATGATLENLAAAAYLGQINRVQDKNLLASLLAIHTVEGRQAAAANRLAGRGFSLGTGSLEGALPDGAFGEPMTMGAVRAALRRYTA
jgi:hypothetical protein